MNATKKTARIAGLLYLLMGIPAAFSWMYVPSKLIVREDATATVENILAHESLFRLGIVSGLASVTIFMFLALTLYGLFKGVNRQQASLLVILVLIQVPITFLNEVSSLAALILGQGADFLSALDKSQLDSLAMLFLNLHHQGLVVSEIFWGLWLFPFGLLVYSSRFIPRILGIWLIINGFGYVIMSLTGILLPQYYNLVFRSAFPALLGEVAIQLWLLIVGAKTHELDATASSSASS